MITIKLQMDNAVIKVELIQSRNRENNDNLTQREDLEQLNRFTALENAREDNAKIPTDDVVLEININTKNFTEDVEDTSHEDSAFVDATQLIKEDTSSEGEGSQQQDILVWVQKDMEFLKESWANMAADEEAEQRLLKELEKEGDCIGGASDGFNLVQQKKKS